MIDELRRVAIAIPRTPTSANGLGFRGNPRQLHRAKKAWEQEITMLLMAEGLPQRPQLQRVRASIVLRFPQRRTRDEGNFRLILEKALGDALRGEQRAWPEGRWIPDDTPAHFVLERLELCEDPGPPRTLITLEW